MIQNKRVSIRGRRAAAKWTATARLESRPPSFENGRVAIIASWAEDDRVSASISRTVLGLRSHGYECLLMRASDSVGELSWVEPVEDVVIVRRTNVGYDFGSWVTALALWPEILTTPKVLMLNDSIIGPFAPLNELINSFETSEGSAWGATSNRQYFPHIQSFFMGFLNGSLATAPLREFWRSVAHSDDKEEIIFRFELGLNRVLVSEGYVVDAFLPVERFSWANVNPALDLWKQLLNAGFPFVKRSLLTSEIDIPTADAVVDYVESRTGYDPRSLL